MMGYDNRSGKIMPNPTSLDDQGAQLSDMTRRGRTMLEKDRDDSTRYSARIEAGMIPKSQSRKDTVDFLRKPIDK